MPVICTALKRSIVKSVWRCRVGPQSTSLEQTRANHALYCMGKAAPAHLAPRRFDAAETCKIQCADKPLRPKGASERQFALSSRLNRPGLLLRLRHRRCFPIYSGVRSNTQFGSGRGAAIRLRSNAHRSVDQLLSDCYVAAQTVRSDECGGSY
jgi:hypothetical protein